MTSKASIATVTLITLSLAGTAAGATLRSIDTPPLEGATQEGEIILSERPEALDKPALWKCDRIVPDYRRWLEDGKPADAWRYVGHTYRDAETGELYDWQDWLDWADDAGCPVYADGNVAGVSGTGVGLGTAITALGTGLLLASGGSDAKSPG